jgi:hypothetical protein
MENHDWWHYPSESDFPLFSQTLFQQAVPKSINRFLNHLSSFANKGLEHKS